MKNYILLSLLLLASLRNVMSQDLIPGQVNDYPLLNELCPQISGTTLKGDTIAVSMQGNAVLVLHFWSLGCGACYKELPELNSLAKKFASDSVKIVSVIREPRQVVLNKLEISDSFYALKKETFKNKAIDFEVITGGDVIMKSFETDKVMGVPLTLIIDSDGIIRAISNSYYMSYEDTAPDQSKNYEVLNTLIESVLRK